MAEATGTKRTRFARGAGRALADFLFPGGATICCLCAARVQYDAQVLHAKGRCKSLGHLLQLAGRADHGALRGDDNADQQDNAFDTSGDVVLEEAQAGASGDMGVHGLVPPEDPQEPPREGPPDH
eukprot:357414-Chlamydomonas_euryale.AAC.2